MDGILIETEKPVSELSCTARWAVEAELCVTHRVDYKVLDYEFDAASDNMILWHACSEGLGGWSNRFPADKERPVPVAAEPMMEVVVRNVDCRRASADTIQSGWIISRHEIFVMPTIERERILQSKFDDRIPTLATAFRLT